MKRMLILTVVTVSLSSLAGCRCCDWLFRGARYEACPPPAVTFEPSCDPCDPCGVPPAITPGPSAYTIPAE